jgi:PAS domain S-box-containing protein
VAGEAHADARGAGGRDAPHADDASRLARRERELAALQAIALAVSRGSDVHGVLDAAMGVLHETFRATLTTWTRFDPIGNLLTIEAQRGLSAELRAELDALPVALGNGLAGTTALTRLPQLTANYATDPRRMTLATKLPPFRGAMCAPVLAGDELLGVIGVGSTELAYDESELGVLASIGSQLGMALENARLVERLRASETRYRTFVEAMPYAIYEARPSGELLYASARVEELTGHPRERFEREPGLYLSLIHPDDRELRTDKLAQLVRPGDRMTLEYRLVHANGFNVWVFDRAQAREAPPGRAGEAPASLAILGVLVDLRERKLIEAAAREHARLASLGELAAGVAHEVNNPLSGIINYAQLAQRVLEVRPPNVLERLDEQIGGILAEADRILEITRTLVSFARRPEKEAFRPLPVHELVRASLTIMKQRLKENSIALDVDVPEDLPPLRARGHELTQVLQNLINNARVALDQRYPRWDPAKRLSFRGAALPGDATSPAGYVRLEVTDRGVGIPASDLPKVFTPFFTTKPQGTGLGLAISREIVLAHGGRLEARSTPEEGTTFSLVIPAFA